MRELAIKRFKSPLVIAVILSLALHAIVSLYFVSNIPIGTAPHQPEVVQAVLKSIQVAPVASTSKKPDPMAEMADTYAKELQAYQALERAGQKFILPPPAKLIYQGFVNGGPITSGQVDWQQDSQTYSLAVKVSLVFFGDFVFTSTGKIDEYGIAPELYREQRGSRGDRVVTLMRDQGVVSFSMNKELATLPPGTQDRFSILFQLAGLVTGDPAVDAQGVARDIPIASIDKVETWTFLSLGDEVIQQNNRDYKARHFVRKPRDEGDNRRVEVWLSENDHYLPIRMRQTEANGTTYELLANQILYQ